MKALGGAVALGLLLGWGVREWRPARAPERGSRASPEAFQAAEVGPLLARAMGFLRDVWESPAKTQSEISANYPDEVLAAALPYTIKMIDCVEAGSPASLAELPAGLRSFDLSSDVTGLRASLDEAAVAAIHAAARLGTIAGQSAAVCDALALDRAHYPLTVRQAVHQGAVLGFEPALALTEHFIREGGDAEQRWGLATAARVRSQRFAAAARDLMERFPDEPVGLEAARTLACLNDESGLDHLRNTWSVFHATDPPLAFEALARLDSLKFDDVAWNPDRVELADQTCASLRALLPLAGDENLRSRIAFTKLLHFTSKQRLSTEGILGICRALLDDAAFSPTHRANAAHLLYATGEPSDRVRGREELVRLAWTEGCAATSIQAIGCLADVAGPADLETVRDLSTRHPGGSVREKANEIVGSWGSKTW
ncbi:MAG: hypothetical protein HY812_22365 [Planctomycetes bacterium]|nr:hypothetical protein [Planctomycetota bacterium]